MTFEPSAQKGAFADRKPIKAEELGALRREVWGDGSVSAPEAEKLFDMNRVVQPSSLWTEFFVEAICEFMLSQGEPRGYVTEDEATWLLRRVNRQGRLETHSELELIVKLLERAEYAPSSLRRFALGAIERTVLSGEGPTREGKPTGKPHVDDAEAAMIRRLIFAPASDGPAKVSAAEADMLFRLKDSTLGQENSPEWKKLFVQGIANHLMTYHGAPSSGSDDTFLEPPFPADDTADLGALLGHDPANTSDDRNEAIDPLNGPIGANSASASQGNWRKRLYDPAGLRDEYEVALLDFLAKDGPRAF